MSLTKTDLNITEFHVSGCKLVANVVYEAIICKSYPTLPRKANIIVEKVTELYKREIERVTDDFYSRFFANYDELFDWLNENVTTIPEIQELNLSQDEYDSGISVNNPDRSKYVFSSRYSPALPESDD